MRQLILLIVITSCYSQDRSTLKKNMTKYFNKFQIKVGN